MDAGLLITCQGGEACATARRLQADATIQDAFKTLVESENDKMANQLHLANALVVLMKAEQQALSDAHQEAVETLASIEHRSSDNSPEEVARQIQIARDEAKRRDVRLELSHRFATGFEERFPMTAHSVEMEKFASRLWPQRRVNREDHDDKSGPFELNLNVSQMGGYQPSQRTRGKYSKEDLKKTMGIK